MYIRENAKPGSLINPLGHGHVAGSTGTAQEFAETLDTLAKSAMDNEIRLRRVEMSMKLIRDGSDKVCSDYTILYNITVCDLDAQHSS